MEVPNGVAVKLAALAVHVQEALGAGGHFLDIEAAKGLAADPEVAEWLGSLDPALLPVKRSGA